MDTNEAILSGLAGLIGLLAAALVVVLLLMGATFSMIGIGGMVGLASFIGAPLDYNEQTRRERARYMLVSRTGAAVCLAGLGILFYKL